MTLDDFPEPEALLDVPTKEQPDGLLDEDEAHIVKDEEPSLFVQFNTVIEVVATLSQKIEERLSYDRVKEEAFDRLYVEVEEVRQERSFQQLRPLLIDLILLYDRIELGLQQIYVLKGNMPDVAQLLESYRDEVLEVLYRREVEPIIATSSFFDRTIQQVIKIQPTSFANEDKQVVRVVRRGFRYHNRILRFEEVVISSYKAN